jgi:hypothetical protein
VALGILDQDSKHIRIIDQTKTAMSTPTTSFLKVSGNKIVKEDDPKETPVLLRGAGLGGWMNMENVSVLVMIRNNR